MLSDNSENAGIYPNITSRSRSRSDGLQRRQDSCFKKGRVCHANSIRRIAGSFVLDAGCSLVAVTTPLHRRNASDQENVGKTLLRDHLPDSVGLVVERVGARISEHLSVR